ncbi:hypothetical protein FOA52_014259 [Chlamydomonas sp. UWO 241]|nr:hypothetical protein FOA52_014259 [Chlamydomonas sp. UWO 241]
MASSVDIRSILPDALLIKGADGKVTTTSTTTLDGKYVGLYFSAHWCPPCRAFTPQLKEAYEALTKAGKPFEIVFVSSDRSVGEFNDYYASMPWAAMAWDAKEKAELSTRFSVAGIPTFVMLSPDGQVVSSNARSAVMANPMGFPWEGQAESGATSFFKQYFMYIALAAWILYRMYAMATTPK